MLRSLLPVLLLATVASAQQQPTPQRGRLPPNFPRGPAQPVQIIDPLQAPPRPSDAAPLDLSGTWKGVYFSANDSVILADLTLTTDAARRTLTGELRFKTLPPPSARGRDAQPVEGSSKATGQVDPGSRSVLLALPGGFGPVVGFMPPDMRMRAVYATERGELAGQFERPSGPRPEDFYFLFAREQDAARIKSFAQHAAALQPPFKASGSAPAEEALAKWVAEYEKEYPTDPGGGVAGISARGLPLLNDAHFKPLFGDAYDTIDFGRLGAAMRRVGAPVGGGGSYNVPFAQKYGFMQYILWPSPPKLVSVAAMRTIDAWEQETLAHFQKDPAVASAFDDIAAFQQVVKDRVTYAWPSDRRSKEAVFEETRTRMAPAALAANVERAITGASDLAGAKSLASWSKDNAPMLKYCAQPDRDAAQQRIDTKLDAAIEQLLADSNGQLQKLGTGAPAVRAGAAWYRSLMSQFAFAGQRPPIRASIDRLSARRDQDLAAGQEHLLQQIAACKTTADVDAIILNDVSVPGDESKPAYGAIADAARTRKAAIQEATMMSLFSADEKEYMDRPGHIDLAKGRGKAPSAESIRLAILRGYAGRTGTMIDAHTARSVTRSMSLFIPFPMIVSVTNESLRSFHAIEGTNDFECDYTVLAQLSIPQDNVIANYDAEVRKGADGMMKLANGFSLAASSTPCVQKFHLYEDGWGVPSMRDLAGAESALDALLKPR